MKLDVRTTISIVAVLGAGVAAIYTWMLSSALEIDDLEDRVQSIEIMHGGGTIA